MKITLIAIILLILNGCSSVEKLNILSTPVEKTPLNLKLPDKLVLEDIEWKVITKTNSNEVFKQLADKKIDQVLIGLTDNDYEKLSVNMLKIRNYIVEYQFILKEYKKYYEDNVNDTEQQRNTKNNN